MNPWSFRRKVTYLVVAVAILLFITVIPAVFLFYNQPTCFDNKQNGDETGVDCGGGCQILCQSEAVEPTVLWSRAFNITNNIYSLVAYVDNPNVSSESFAQYEFNLFDENNVLIANRKNTVYIPRNKVLAIFEPNIIVSTGTPVRTTFSFVTPIEWRRTTDESSPISVIEKILSDEGNPRVDAIVKNDSIESIKQVEAVALVYDNKSNALGVSRTFVDNLAPNESRKITFTWPKAFPVSQEVCRVSLPGTNVSRPESLGVMLAIDRSGSMVSQGSNPPQPITDVKNAVVSFIGKLMGTDQVGVVSFASSASDPVDSTLTRDYRAAIDIVQSITVATSSTQYTNIADGIEKSLSQFTSVGQNFLTNKAIILLTDGVANRPEDPNNPEYPEIFAMQKADEAKQLGVQVYTIGLGNETNEEFLKNLASLPDNYFKATTSKDLESIYQEIAVSICSNDPAVVEIVTKVLPENI